MTSDLPCSYFTIDISKGSSFKSVKIFIKLEKGMNLCSICITNFYIKQILRFDVGYGTQTKNFEVCLFGPIPGLETVNI